MAKCREVEPLFASYVDGETAPPERAEVDAHLIKCPPCRDRVAGERTAREILKARATELRAPAPEPLRVRCAACAGDTAHPGSRASVASVLRRRPWVPLSLAATLVLAVGWVFLFGLNDRVEALAAQLALDHVKCFQFPPSSRNGGDAASLSREWSAKQGWSISVPSSVPAEQLELIGVRRCLSSQGRLAHIMYRWHGAPLSVYVLNSSVTGALQTPPAEEAIVAKFGEEAVIWQSAGRTYAVVGRGRPTDLQHVAAYVRRTAE
jgi:anti-sigma factor RsiW